MTSHNPFTNKQKVATTCIKITTKSAKMYVIGIMKKRIRYLKGIK